VAATDFIAASKPLKEALKSANLLKTLKFNTLISGEPGTGRHTLARLMMPDAPIVQGDDENLYAQIEKQPRLIVDRIETVEQPSKFYQNLRKHGTQVVAVAPKGFEEEQNPFFSVRIVLPPLAERPEDVVPLVEKFRAETLAMFGEHDADFRVDMGRLDLSRNAFSLRRSVVLQYMERAFGEEELMEVMERFLAGRMEGAEGLYRKMLYLYEVPLIRAGVKRYRSQLKMSQVFGLNRNTLRKKINDWKRWLE
jgi:DNA-binding NtrC family response regulator